MGPLGWQETVFIFILALLIFGPRKLPELGKTVGKAMTEFRRASNELKSTWNREMADIEREGQSIKETTRKLSQDIKSSFDANDTPSGYDYDYEQEYGNEINPPPSSGSPANDSSKVSASATQGAESTASDSQTGKAPDGAVPTTVEAVSAPPADSSRHSESKAVTT